MTKNLETDIHEWSKTAVEKMFLANDPLAALKALVDAKVQEITTSGETYEVPRKSWDWACAEADKLIRERVKKLDPK